MGDLFITSDTHFGHANIIKYCNRPFKDVDEMDNRLIKNWNERVKKYDQVIHLGDFCFKNSIGGKPGEGTTNNFWHYYSKLNGYITLVKGNHDRNNGTNTKITSLIISFGNNDYFMTHRPPQHPLEMPEFIDICLCGHVHEKWLYKWLDNKLLINMSVDVHGYYPVKMREVERLISKIRKNQV